ncbi:glycosyltransferase family 2 protein [Phenylobacterium sp. LjRoot225]|uniref:glycosyltransferase family 2 protein n=1 Tax=Phenylobacterium sp. LjRoot225 TaxID=3342285 RepID=UPI003ECDCA40
MPQKPLTIVVPMAGRGSRFADAGFKDPKPLIPVKGVPMIKLVIDNLRPSRPHRFVFICQREHVAAYDLERLLGLWAPGSAIVQLDGVTEGAACSVLTAEAWLDDSPLMIANSDQYLDIAIDDYLDAMEGCDGLIMTMTASDPKWSFVAVDDQGFVTEVAEKVPISDEATVGVYNFARGRDFAEAAREMIAKDLRVNGEFYVAPVYNMLIEQGAKIAIHNIGAEADGMYGLGVPSDLALFLSLPIAERVAA